jgi:CSLREA domain-containing protein
MRRLLSALLISLLWFALFALGALAQTQGHVSPFTPGREPLPRQQQFTIPPIQPPTGATITVTTTADELDNDSTCSLRQAIQAANTDTAVGGCPAGNGDDLIILPTGVYGLTSEGRSEDDNVTGDLDIRSSLMISGAGAEVTIIDANQIDRVLHIHEGVMVTVSGVTIRNGKTADGTNSGCGTDGDDPCPGSPGAGILNTGNLVVYTSIISENQTGRGGKSGTGAYDEKYGLGGGGGGIYSLGQITIISSTIRNNSTTGQKADGGGLYAEGIADLMNSVIYNNRTTDYQGEGGGAYLNGTATLIRSEIISNGTGLSGNGGGISNLGTLSLLKSTISNNMTGKGAVFRGGRPGGNGGGIYNTGVFTVDNGSIINNRTGDGSSGSVFSGGGGAGGGIFSNGYIAIYKTQVTSNVTGDGAAGWGGRAGGAGGGISNSGTAIIDESWIANNQTGGGGDGVVSTGSGGSGGGIANSGNLTLFSSSLTHNITGIGACSQTTDYGGYGRDRGYGGDGGGLYNAGMAIVKNTTLSGNLTGDGKTGCQMGLNGSGGRGGGIANISTGGLLIESSTLSRNEAGQGGGCNVHGCSFDGDTGGISNMNGAVSIYNTILSDNRATDTQTDCSGIITSYGHNLIQQTSVCTISGITTNIITNQFAWLAPLADNGGPTPTHALLPQSPALNAGSCTAIDGAPITTDQRGEPRPQGAGCDIGAFESALSHIPPETIHLPLVGKGE